MSDDQVLKYGENCLGFEKLLWRDDHDHVTSQLVSFYSKFFLKLIVALF